MNTQQDTEVLYTDCRAKLDKVQADLSALATHRVTVTPELVNRVFVALHGVKSTAAALRNPPLKQLSHLAEAVLGEVREGRLGLSAGNVDALLSATESMTKMVVTDERRSNAESSADLERLNAILSQQNNRRDMVSTKADARPIKSLVTEDDFACRVLLQGLLSKYGECHIAMNGREAVKAFQTARQAGQPYDLICMDIQMPGIDGREAVAQIRQVEKSNDVDADGVKILMTTSLRDSKTMFSSFGAKCDDYLVKPVDGKKLVEHLKSLGLLAAAAGSGQPVER